MKDELIFNEEQLRRCVVNLVSVNDCLQRACDELEQGEVPSVNVQYVEGQVNMARTKLYRALNILREVRFIDLLLVGHDVIATIIGDERILGVKPQE